MKRYTFTLEETQEIKAARKKNRDKNVEKRLAALEMRAEGKQNKEINKLHIPENIELFYIETVQPNSKPTIPASLPIKKGTVSKAGTRSKQAASSTIPLLRSRPAQRFTRSLKRTNTS